ncbi:DUF87 domain-containing protein [Mesomycoplasma ovipneumoniae]|uniref:DUF87 domain-containing protein n=1 Tax=Mesomycoplasma ovipneumoniae TaxID=29562 RepID=A0AAW6Q5A0_9BACT|nr:DUF87 domain-containing protein [Mesomycoplasma ovipneumoniae]MDF9627737.1 DUF87 domain-containing protein [Mesomycoplasma ovipneumoniae]MDO4157826.1 DUF87 domain-containing protein [Mesomycoplasma ovipneumoniae]MDO4158717.1 DUF87 domain-containing protein [Mesomycoplasma ovipneumoniae]MDO6822099.1 DUF87 domain-containing protein [Mesomycoplasma ovipneumoniae]MDO6855927.1 DUF87 domain-containing protein [Mesomycoplasma ovipneumoniae]
MKKQVQNKPIQKIKVLFFKNFSIADLLVLFAIVVFCLVCSFAINAQLHFLLKILIFLILFSFLGLPMIFHFPKFKARGWQILFYWFKYISMPRKYSSSASGSTNSKNLIPYLSINKNYIETDGGWIGGLKLKGIEIFSYDEDQQKSILLQFANLINNINQKISIVKIAKQNNIETNQEHLQKNFNICTNNLGEKLCDSYEEDLNYTFEGQMKFSYYLIVHNERENELTFEINILKQKLAHIEIEAEKLKIDELLNLAVGILNPFDKFSKEQIENLVENPTRENIQSAFSLSEIRWKPTYFQSMNKYFSIQGVSELPLELPPYWANNFFNSQSNIVWHIQKLSDREKDKILNRAYSILSLNSEETNASVLNRRKNQLEQEAIENVVDVAASGQNIFFSTFLFVNQANSKDALKNIERENEQIVKNSGSIIHTLIFNQLNAYVNSFFKYTDTLKERIEMPSNNIAWGFPFSTREFNDNNYNILGTNFSDGTPLFFDQFYQKSSRKNSNLFILGTSGSGKTTITKKLVTYNIGVGNSVIILDPQNEYAKIGKNLRANIIHLNSSGLTVFNPLQIRKTFNPNSNETEEIFSNPDLIALHISKLETFFKIIFPSLKNVHFIAILNSLKILYQSYGFFEINNKDITKLKNNEYPIISDLIQTIKKTDFDYLSENDKKVLIASFETDFGQYSVLGRMFNNISNAENLNSNFTIFNVASLMNLEKRVYQAAFFLALSFIQGQISDFYQENDKKIVLVVDEGHKFVDESNLFALNFLFDTAKTIRKYNGGLIITTQNPGDFAISGEAARKSEAIIENCQYSIFFNLKSKDIEKIDLLYRNVGGLSDEEKNFINLSQIGDMLLTVNTIDRFKLSSYYNNIEKELFFDKGDRLND